VKSYGEEKWNEIVSTIDFPHIIIDTSNVDDRIFFELLSNIQKVLNIEYSEIFDLFAEHWIFSYVHRIGFAYFLSNHTSSKEALTEMDRIHKIVTINVLGSKPPSFRFTWLDDNTLFIDYLSERNLIDLCVSLIKAIAKYYSDKIKVEKIENNQLKVIFLVEES
jgi:hypothetical protein